MKNPRVAVKYRLFCSMEHGTGLIVCCGGTMEFDCWDMHGHRFLFVHYFTTLRMTMCSFILPFRLVSIALMFPRNFRSWTLPAFITSASCSFGLRNDFCTDSPSLNSLMYAPLTVRPPSS